MNYFIAKKEDLKNLINYFENEPFYVYVRPIFGCRENQCHYNVNKYVSEYGGERIVGYFFIKSLDTIIAIKHSIWKYKGEYLDITPFKDERFYNAFIESNKINFKSLEFVNDKVNKIEFNI